MNNQTHSTMSEILISNLFSSYLFMYTKFKTPTGNPRNPSYPLWTGTISNHSLAIILILWQDKMQYLTSC